MPTRGFGKPTLVLIILCLTSCSTLRPLPIQEPKNLADADAELPGLGRPLDIDHGQKILNGYANAYTGAAEKLYSANYKASDATFGGGVLGMIGGLTKSPQTAIVGAALSGAGGITAQRYAFQIQANNYEGAAQAMECMSDVLAYANADEVDLPDLSYRINDVRRKLRKNQAKIDIATADLTALQTALKVQLEAAREKKDADDKKAAAQFQFKAAGNHNFLLANSLAQATSEARDKAIELNRANLLKCATAY